MKRNLLTIFLALALVVALTFVIAPSAKAETTETIMKATGTSLPDGFDFDTNILDLNGHNVTVEVPDGETLCVVDTANTNKDGVTGAGKLIKSGDGKVATVSQYPEVLNEEAEDYHFSLMRYLMLKNDGEDTYSFHPFNLTISQLGLNTKKSAICLQATFMANDKAIGAISDHGISIDDVPHTAVGEYPFESNFIIAYADLTDSLKDDAALDLSKTAKAYIKIGNEYIYSTYEANITPRQVLKGLNNAETVKKATETQKTAIVENLATKNHLKNLFTSFTNTECEHQGGTATCTVLAECIDCDVKYGVLAEHNYKDVWDIKCDNTGCGATRTVLYGEDFDKDQTLTDAGWNNSANANITNGTLNITHTAASGNTAIFHGVESASKVTVEFDFTLNYEGDDDTSHAMIRLRNDGTNALVMVAQRHQIKIGSKWVPYGNTWASGTSHKIKLVVDASTSAGTCAVYIDGVFKDSVAFAASVNTINQIVLGAQGNESGITGITVSYDNVSVYCDAEKVIHSDDFDKDQALTDAGWNNSANANITNGTLNITHTAASGNTAIFHGVESASKVTVEFDFTLNYEGNDDTSHAMIRLRNDETNALVMVARRHQIKIGSKWVPYGNTWASGTSHKIKLVVDASTSAGTCAVYIDGVFKDSVAFAASVNTINQIVLGAQGNESGITGITVSYDNLLICKQ